MAGRVCAAEVRVGVYENEPKVFTDAQGVPSGILIDLLKAVADNEGWQLAYVSCKWEDCLKKLEAGSIDLMPDVAYSVERDLRFDFHPTPALYSWSQVYRNGNIKISSILDLKGKRIALLGGGIQEKTFSEMLAGFNVEAQLIRTSTLDEAFRLAQSGRADAAVSNQYFGEFHKHDFKVAETPIIFQPARLFYATAQERRADLLDGIEKHLAAWHNTPGSPYFEVIKRWGGREPETLIPPVFWKALIAVIVLMLLAMLGVIILHKQVDLRTRELSVSNAGLQRSTRLYAALSRCNRSIVHSMNEAELFPLICQAAVEFGGMKMAWIGKVDEQTRRVIPVASFGTGTEYLESLHILIDGNLPAGRGPTGIALREDRPFWCQDFANDPATAPWHESGAHFGWGASASLPLSCRDAVVGVLGLYAGETNAFDEAARNLLLEMAMDISFALSRFADEIERKENEERIEHLTHFDQLTGLPNRTLLNDRFKYTLSLAQRSKEKLVVMFLDLDNFKAINETLGHTTGDQLLMEVARRLKASLREEDTVSRQGGDEFFLILPDTDETGATNVAAKLIEAVSRPCRIEQHELVSTSSIGIAIYPHDGADLETLSKNADAAMFRAKQDGRNNFRFFTPEMQTHSARTLQLSSALHHALSHNQLQLHYQPQVSIQDGHVTGAEALLRWQHPELGTISPAEFIPLAEKNGQIVQVGEWVLRTATRQLKEWLDRGFPPMVMAVNLSAVQFRHPDLLELVTGIMGEAGLAHEYLELELTEAVAMNDPQAAIAIMDRLHTHGIRMSIDDFGTGYSSLSYLKRFQIYKLKIDQSFVRDITDNPEDKAIVTAIINLASSLGLQTIAEGVETAGQLAFLRLQGCDEVQGYYFSEPLPAESFAAYLQQQKGS
jgi:diguanylate cyclase (GGDEF)-like protein